MFPISVSDMVTQPPTDAELLSTIERFCSQHEIAPTAFGRAAIGDGNLISNLKANRSVTLKTAHRVLAYMSDYRPAPKERTAA